MNHIHIRLAYNSWWSWFTVNLDAKDLSPILEPGSSTSTIQTLPVPLDQWSNLGGSGMRVDHFHHIFRHFTTPCSRRMKHMLNMVDGRKRIWYINHDISIIYIYLYTYIMWILHDGRWCYILYMLSQCWTYNSCCMEPSFHWFFWNVHKHIYSRRSKFTALRTWNRDWPRILDQVER